MKAQGPVHVYSFSGLSVGVRGSYLFTISTVSTVT